ncbi:MAG: flagellar basal body-associated FliL family protein, partial [Rhodoferax sp.]
MSENPETVEEVKPPAKSKKLLIIIVAAVAVLALGGGGAFYYISKQRAAAAAEDAGDDASGKTGAHAGAKAPPSYLPLENMVVNLADPGGEKVAQIGITLELSDAKATEKVKPFLPSIRSGV